MKLLLPRFALLLSLCLLPLVATANEELDIKQAQLDRRAEAEQKAVSLQKWQSSKKAPSLNQEQFDVDHYELDLIINTNTNTIGGTVTMDATVVDGPLAMVELDLDMALAVSVVRAGGGFTTWTHAADILSIDLDQSYSIGESFSVEISYGGSPDETKRAFNFSSRSDQPLVWSLSEPYGARTWWPCKDTPSDKAATARMRFTVPDGFTAVSNGVLQSTASKAGLTTFDWFENYPITTYLISVAIHPYQEHTVTYTPLAGGSMPVTMWSSESRIYGDPLESAAFILDQLVVFRDLFGEYPFVDEKYGQAEYVWTGGMEHQTVTSIGSWWQEYLIAHELAHQWFGDAVTCESFSHIWLNEGFATYAEALWYESKYGIEGYHNFMRSLEYKGSGTLYVPPSELDNPNRIFSYLSYDKGAWILHMLRGIMGDALFMQFLRDWTNSPNVSYGTATTEDLQAHAESVSGRDLSNFFASWIYEEYFPTYAFTWSAQNQGASWDVSVDVEQVQSQALYEMPVQLRVTTTGGVEDFTVENNAVAQNFVLNVASEPTGVELDPDNWILKQMETKVEDPSFHRGVLLVNGIPWGNGAGIRSAYMDSTFTGYTPFEFWDTRPEPPWYSYPAQLPPPRGRGKIPPEILGEYSTVIWAGDENGDGWEAWIDAGVATYLQQGGNVLLMSSQGRSYLTPVRANYLGIRWDGESYRDDILPMQAAYPLLVDMIPIRDLQTSAHFPTEYEQPEAVTLFNTTIDGVTRATGVWRQPTGGGTLRPSGGHFAHIAGRPDSWSHEELRYNVEVILARLFGEGTGTDVDIPITNRRVALHLPVPNPFNPRVQLSYELAAPGHVRLTIYDQRGRVVRTLMDQEMPAGAGSILWDGKDSGGSPAASGVYSVVLEAGGQSHRRKATLLR